MPWPQIYDPFGALAVSTVVAAIPVVVLLGTLALLKWHAHNAALAGLAAALVVAIGAFHMPPSMALASAGYGAAYGLLPIGWIVLNVIFLYQLTNERGLFTVLRESITARHRRSPPAAAAGRVLLRRVLRRRRRLRHAGRGHRRDPDGPRLHAARRLRACR